MVLVAAIAAAATAAALAVEIIVVTFIKILYECVELQNISC